MIMHQAHVSTTRGVLWGGIDHMIHMQTRITLRIVVIRANSFFHSYFVLMFLLA